MASLIEAVTRQALATFSNKLSTFSFEENLSKLKLLANKLTSADVKLDKSLLGINNESDKSNLKKERLAPVTYIEVFENNDVTVGIFILRAGTRLPLHDHPLMYGILKVIAGTVHISSYSPISRLISESGDTRETDVSDESVKFSNDLINPWDIDLTSKSLYKQVTLLAVKEPEVLLSEKDEVCVLCPRQGNIHEIHSVNGPAAFLDILAPPYDSNIPGVGPRPCRYFKEITHTETNSVKTLISIPHPIDYWSDSAPYQGPRFMAES